MKIFLRILLGLFIVLVLIISSMTIYLAVKSPGKTQPIPGGIASLEQVELNGLKQWVLMRGNNENLPVLLILHGGPGSPELAMVTRYNKELEKHFIVVNWEQRGAGKSYDKNIPKEAMTIAAFVSDAKSLVKYLKTRFKKDKIYIEGHSWGSALGALLIQQIPLDVKAYIGIGQVTDALENEKLGFEWAFTEAMNRGDKKAIAQLKAIGPPPYSEFRKTGIERKWVAMYGGTVYKNPLKLLGNALVNCGEYTLEDKLIKYAKGSMFSLDSMWDELMRGNMFKSAAVWKVPVYIIAGRHDKTVVSSQVEEYFNFIKAPKKEFFWFEESAHMASYEEPEKYLDIMVNRVIKENE